MSLILKEIKGRIAKKDITVYKVVQKHKVQDRSNPMYYSPYQNDPCYLNIEAKAMGDLAVRICKSLQGPYVGYIEKGVFHAYRTLSEARAMQKCIPCRATSFTYTILEAIIPEGSLYFIGEDGDIASTRIKYLKELQLCV